MRDDLASQRGWCQKHARGKQARDSASGEPGTGKVYLRPLIYAAAPTAPKSPDRAVSCSMNID